MADVKISALPAVVTAATTDIFAIVQGGVTYKATLTQVVAAITSTGLTATAGALTVNLSTGVAGGQSVIGGTAASNNLTLSSTTNATKGKLLFGTSAYDEVNNRLGIGTASPVGALQVSSSAFPVARFDRTSTTAGAALIAINSLNSINTVNMVDGYGGLMVFGIQDDAGVLNEIADFGAARDGADNNGAAFIRTANAGTRAIRFQIFNTGNVLIQNGGTHTDAGFRLDVNGTARVQGNLTISDTSNIVLATGTGTRIGTATTQKLGFWNATPIAQPTTAVAAATLVGGGGTTLTDTDTFDGYTLAQVVKALRNAGLLA